VGDDVKLYAVCPSCGPPLSHPSVREAAPHALCVLCHQEVDWVEVCGPPDEHDELGGEA
jgi:hypothetical protein